MIRSPETGGPLFDKLRPDRPGTALDLRFLNALRVSDPPFI
jgi:hypothetical protein